MPLVILVENIVDFFVPVTVSLYDLEPGLRGLMISNDGLLEIKVSSSLPLASYLSGKKGFC